MSNSFISFLKKLISKKYLYLYIYIYKFLLQLSNDGSGIGAALTVAAELVTATEIKNFESKQTGL
jgi:hypothetical protein